MHRYIAFIQDDGRASNAIITAETSKEALELLHKYDTIIGHQRNVLSIHLLTGKYKDLPVEVYISKKWIKFKNE